ncbi:hypothetical protein ARC78_09945 [Stenotrophomonas pictorum JCM 9942]|uniref:DUF2809 domain-containing protein n=1 Tax=Stenotrophomonas pictorum JCM 9942 TaxID=1236960 RepID=A0A0R0AAE5_9GAMM|nr:DUF2809 domain-containing protein [Stenotrophomonas pictorum]KRG41995.1 hypothetical protein ARC78_09945 [Stenotrophomonas pictorum JCM 9942]
MSLYLKARAGWGVFAFSPWHMLLAIALFLLEVVIATQLSQVTWIRAYLGDVLVVVLLYAAIRSVVRVDDHALLLGVFGLACAMEVAQYFALAERLGYVRGDVMHTLIGNTFSWADIACYAIGCAVVAGGLALFKR